MTEEEKVNSGLFLMNKVDEYKNKQKITNPELKVIATDCALLGWHACLDWLEDKGIDVHKAFDVEVTK